MANVACGFHFSYLATISRKQLGVHISELDLLRTTLNCHVVQQFQLELKFVQFAILALKNLINIVPQTTLKIIPLLVPNHYELTKYKNQ